MTKRITTAALWLPATELFCALFCLQAHRHLRIKLNEFVTARYGADVNEKLALR